MRDKERVEPVAMSTVTSDAVADSGKTGAATIQTSGLLDEEDKKPKPFPGRAVVEKAVTYRVPIIKALDEKRLLTGVVLEPDDVDAHYDTIPADVIETAAHEFLAEYNKSTNLGLQHEDMDPPLHLVESWIVPIDLVLGDTTVKKGSWVITVKVDDDELWQSVKDGKYTGFSIGGLATVQSLEQDAA